MYFTIIDRDTFHKVEFLGFKLFGDSVEIARVCQEFRVLSLAQQRPSSTFTVQFSYMHPDPESSTPLPVTAWLESAGGLVLKRVRCVAVAAGCRSPLFNKLPA